MNLFFYAVGPKIIQKKRDDKNKKNIRALIKLLNETDPLIQRKVARNLNRLFLVTFDDIDVTLLLKVFPL